MKYIVLFTLLLVVFNAAAQQMGCDSSRYNSVVFSNVNTYSNIQYGQNTTLSGQNSNLIMDIFEPMGDTLSARPVVVLAHGGSFVSGNKSDLAPMCETLARMGYVAVSINYRLIDALVTDSIGMTGAVLMAVNDMYAAVRFFREDAATSNTYKVDSNFIFAGGVSAGAIMAAHVAHLDSTDNIPTYIQTHINNQGGYYGNSSNNKQYGSSVQGALIFSGALLRDHWIDPNDPPYYAVHEEFDQVVPCPYGAAGGVFFPQYSYGGCAMETVANAQGVTNEFRFYPNDSGHVDYLSTDYAVIFQESTDFLKDILCANGVGLQEQVLYQSVLYPNPCDANLFIQSRQRIVEIDLFDLNGRRVKTFQANGVSVQVDVSDVPPGVYLIGITTEDKMFENRRLVIQR